MMTVSDVGDVSDASDASNASNASNASDTGDANDVVCPESRNTCLVLCRQLRHSIDRVLILGFSLQSVGLCHDTVNIHVHRGISKQPFLTQQNTDNVIIFVPFTIHTA